jgi:hypothetical protein
MHSTRHAALRAALKTIACAMLALAFMAAPAAAADRPGPCADRLCKRYEADTPTCWRFERRKKVARCFIARAAAHYRQPRRKALHIAWRESRYNWRVTNPSSGTAGLYQFARATWRHTPYRGHSRYNPRWAALAAMWMWAHGGYSHWS